jgi:hypothetical protein
VHFFEQSSSPFFCFFMALTPSKPKWFHIWSGIFRIAGLILPCCIPLQTGNSSNNHRRLNRRPDFLPGPHHFWDLCFPSSSPCLSFADHSKSTLTSEYVWHSINPSKLRDEGKPLRCTTFCTREAAVKGPTWGNSRVEN